MLHIIFLSETVIIGLEHDIFVIGALKGKTNYRETKINLLI